MYSVLSFAVYKVNTVKILGFQNEKVYFLHEQVVLQLWESITEFSARIPGFSEKTYGISLIQNGFN